MNKPNIFEYATSELSQDAMICYLLEWAKSEHKEIDEATHKIGVRLLDTFFDKHKDTIDKPESYKSIKIEKQYQYIDVLCTVNEIYPIIIEDKANTKNHGTQLEDYIEVIKKEKKYLDENIMKIYFKTFDQSCYKEIEDNKYKVFLRKEILDVLKSYATDNIIVNDYKEYLQEMEDNINSYKVKTFNNWNYDSWKGFFIRLKEELNHGNWGYVSNPNGGFLGFWFNWRDTENTQTEIYMQIEYHHKQKSNKFNIKLSNKDKVKIDKNIAEKYMHGEKRVIKEHVDFKFIRPRKISFGKTMTIAELEQDFIILNKDNTVDIDRTIKKIKEIMNAINSFVK